MKHSSPRNQQRPTLSRASRGNTYLGRARSTADKCAHFPLSRHEHQPTGCHQPCRTSPSYKLRGPASESLSELLNNYKDGSPPTKSKQTRHGRATGYVRTNRWNNALGPPSSKASQSTWLVLAVAVQRRHHVETRLLQGLLCRPGASILGGCQRYQEAVPKTRCVAVICTPPAPTSSLDCC